MTALGDSREAEVVASGLGFPQAVDRFSVLFIRVPLPPSFAEMKDLCKELSDLNELRNKHIHSSWGFWASGKPMQMRKRLWRNQGVARSMTTVPPTEVLEVASRLTAMAEAIYDMRAAYIGNRRNYRLD